MAGSGAECTGATRGREWRHSLRRLARHACVGRWALRRDFPKATLDAIEAAIRDAESRHSGEIRFAIEASLHPWLVWRGVTPRERAVHVFSQLRVWDTEHNNGVLIFLLLADHAVEIVADRGVAGGRVKSGEWMAVARRMEAHFRDRHFRAGCVAGVDAIADVLQRYPPAAPDIGNELPDAPVILR